MTYFRLSIMGVTSGGERWSINPTYDPNGEIPSDFQQTTLNAMVQAALETATPAWLLGVLSPSLSIVSARLELRSDSDDSLQRVGEYALSSGRAGTNAAKMPPQCAIVISTRTDQPGSRGRGRLYWPCPSAVVSAGLRLSQPTAAQIAGDAATYFKDMGDAMFTASGGGAPWQAIDLCVRSRASKQSPHVTRLEVGDVIDTQRRRRDTLIEARSSAAYPPA